MAEIINLRKARKRKTRDAKEAAAEANRLKFGRSKSERSARKAEEALLSRRLDEHKRED